MDNPYAEYEHTLHWHVIKWAIEQLVNNGDITIHTDINYVIGYIITTMLED
jgi:hypothetical protein